LVGFGEYFLVEAQGVFSHHAVKQVGPEDLEHGKGVGAHGNPGSADPHAAGHGEGHKGPLAWTYSTPWVSLGEGATSGGKVLPALVIPMEVHVDNLTVIMFLMVTFIATLIHVYSMGYMHDDPRYPRFFAYLSLFCFSMLGLVASANVFMVFLFWELVGVCSYLLIGFWYEEKKNADAANKAFIVNRVGDVGMLMGLGLLWTSLGTFNINEVNQSLRDDAGKLHVVSTPQGEVVRLHDRETGAEKLDDAGRPRQIATWALVLAGLGVFAGCVGKSAQFPLHVWLPDAMAGPTPVSALIHAATMVAAGVYLVGRFYPLFTDQVLLYIAYTGGITLFIAATIAMVQTDYKKVLAYSTVSQLGFMMLGLGVGGWAAGLFHLITHAFFKALLFLGAGSVYHAVHTYEMPVLGGLRRKMPITAYTMLIATLAISGVPFFSGFYSKDAILAASLYRVFMVPGGGKHILLFVLPAVGASITAFYMFRMWFLVFAGEPRGYPEAVHGHGHGHDDHHHGNPYDHAHESGPVMAWPLIALAIPAVFAGWTWQLGLPIDEPVLEYMLTYGEPIRGQDLWSMHYLAMAASVLIAVVGIGGGIAYYAPAAPVVLNRPVPIPLRRRFRAETVASRFPGVHDFLVHKWYFDELYDVALVRPALALARGIGQFDKQIVDGVVNAAASFTELLSRLEGVFDRLAVDGLVNLVARGVYVLGDYGRMLQTGRLRNYLMVLAVAVVGLFAGVFAWVR
ncbi:MAG: NADH-quinone oxidoreductase subunit L, partial [Planctomycetia bacterium]|nr:NADH-quinone oxidoreductase subunit L [Planctomycetia bacterium]